MPGVLGRRVDARRVVPVAPRLPQLPPRPHGEIRGERRSVRRNRRTRARRLRARDGWRSGPPSRLAVTQPPSPSIGTVMAVDLVRSWRPRKQGSTRMKRLLGTLLLVGFAITAVAQAETPATETRKSESADERFHALY